MILFFSQNIKADALNLGTDLLLFAVIKLYEFAFILYKKDSAVENVENYEG